MNLLQFVFFVANRIILYNWKLFHKSKQDQIEIKKDTDRAEEIKALKRAWENVEAGRAAKVKKLLNKFRITF